MDIILLHTPLSAASRDFLASLGVTIPEGDDVTVTIGTDTVRIVSNHAAAVALCPAFPGYPSVVAEVNGEQKILYNPSSLDEVSLWIIEQLSSITKNKILMELAHLDSVLSRESEDIVAAANLYDSLPEIMQERIARKSELRNKLKELL